METERIKDVTERQREKENAKGIKHEAEEFAIA